MKQTLNGQTIYTIYGLDGTLYYRDNATTGETTDYVRMGSHTVGRMDEAGVFTWTHSDHLGSASAATDASGAIIWRESYLPFGEAIEDPAANRDEAGFTGHIRDAATGLSYAQARYLNPVTGRFLAPDPVGFADMGPGYFNRYAYTMNDPVNATDPTGASPIFQFFNFGGERGAATAQAAMTQGARGADPADPLGGASMNPGADALAREANMLSGIGVMQAEATANGLANIGLAAAGAGIPGPVDELAAAGMVAKGASAAQSAVNRVQLGRSLASAQQMSELSGGGGAVLSQPARQAARIGSQYGVNPSNVQKVSSTSHTVRGTGQSTEVHAFRNSETNALYEPKTVIQQRSTQRLQD